MADEQAQTGTQLHLQKLYIRDISFESPKAPAIFTSEAGSQVQVDIRSNSRDIDAELIEVTLTVSVKSVIGEETIFAIEVQQAGIFTISGCTPEEHFLMVGTVCPGTLYPYARQAVTDLADKGGFPELLLQPIDFAALFAQKLQAQAEQRVRDESLQGPVAPAGDKPATH